MPPSAARVARSAGARFAWFSLLALFAAWPYLSTAGALNDFRDAHILSQYETVARLTTLHFGELPAWNPYFCGGLYALGTPQARFASPAFVLTLLFGTERGEAILVMVAVLLALEGAFRLLRDHGVSRLAAILAAPVFGLSGVLACAPMLGWFNFLAFAGVPWALLGVRAVARGELRGAVTVALSLTAMVGLGGTYAVPFTALAAVVELGVLSVRRRAFAWRAVLATAVLAPALAAYRAWPVAETMLRSPRAVSGLGGTDVPQLGPQLFGYWPPLGGAASWYLVGAAAMPAVVLGLWRRTVWPWVGAGLVWLWLAFGSNVRPSASLWLRALPLYSMLRWPERFLVLLAVVLAVLAGWGVVRALALARRRSRWWAVVPAALLANVVMLVANFSQAAHGRSLVAPPLVVEQPFHQARGNRWTVADYAPMNRGSLSCMEAYPVPQSPALRADLVHESWVEGAGGAVVEHAWSPNRLEQTVTLESAGRLVVNQNHHPGWRSNVGTVVSERGLLAVELPAGTHLVSLVFRPVSAVGGLVMSSFAALLAAWLWWRRSIPLAALLLPWLGALLVSRAMPEPPFVPAPSAELEGAPVVAEVLPDGAQPVGARFEGGVSLDGVSTAWRDDHLRLELDWRVVPPLTTGLGVFVHIEPEGSKRLPGDHPLVSGVMTFEAAPPQKILRDVLLVSIPQESKGRPWKVWVGLWAVRGDGARSRVLDAAGLPVDADRLLVTTVTPPEASVRVERE